MYLPDLHETELDELKHQVLLKELQATEISDTTEMPVVLHHMPAKYRRTTHHLKVTD